MTYFLSPAFKHIQRTVRGLALFVQHPCFMNCSAKCAKCSPQRNSRTVKPQFSMFSYVFHIHLCCSSIGVLGWNNFKASWSKMYKDMLSSTGRHDLRSMQLSIVFGPCGFLRLCGCVSGCSAIPFRVYSQSHWIMVCNLKSCAALIPHFCNLVFSSWALKHG